MWSWHELIIFRVSRSRRCGYDKHAFTFALPLNLMAESGLPPSVVFGETEADLWPYRNRTVALLRRYAGASVEVGRLPSLLGREFFSTRVTSYTMRNF